MKPTQWGIFPVNDPEQTLRLRRFFVGSAVYLMTIAFVLLCWALGFLNDRVAAIYTASMVSANAIFYAVIRSGLNKRFKDPSLTAFQIMVSAGQGMTAMYFAGLARGAFLLLGVALFSFGMFRLNTRGFLKLAAGMLSAHALMVAALMVFHPQTTNLGLEVCKRSMNPILSGAHKLRTLAPSLLRWRNKHEDGDTYLGAARSGSEPAKLIHECLCQEARPGGIDLLLLAAQV